MTGWKLYITLGVSGLATIVASLGTVGAVGACNSGNGDCPDKAAVVAGGSCSDNHLQCAYDLATPAAACDGTSTVIETSCTCTDDTWVCPSPFECEAGTAEPDAGDEASTDDGGTADAHD